MSAQCVSLAVLTTEELDVLHSSSVVPRLPGRSRVVALAAFNEETLLGVAQFRRPSDSRVSARYTSELSSLTTLHNDLDVLAVIRHYIEQLVPTDLFVPAPLLQGAEAEDSELVWDESCRGYGWAARDLTFYTYRVSATDSEKYYLGVSHIRSAEASVDDCLGDGYYGSGGGRSNPRNKYSSWRKRHDTTLTKEILGRFSRRAEAFAHERELVGDKWATDPSCLNSIAGGLVSAPYLPYAIEELYCEVHVKLTSHRAGRCMACASSKGVTFRFCPKHGKTKHRGQCCVTCQQEARFDVAPCPRHGEATHRDGQCWACHQSDQWYLADCELHGHTLFLASVCGRCQIQSIYSQKVCSEHGLTTFAGSSCCRCTVQGLYSAMTCVLHGEQLHRGMYCVKCSVEKSVRLLFCEVHGNSFHQGEACMKCSAQLAVSLKLCNKHGLVKHRGDTCYLCTNQSSVSEQVCSTHGMVRFQGGKCCKCVAARNISIKSCEVHGETKHRGDCCYKCSRAKAQLSRNRKALEKASD